MLLHALDASQRGATSICIQSPDTDVLVLALWCYKDLCPATSMLVGTGGLRRTIDLGPMMPWAVRKLLHSLASTP